MALTIKEKYAKLDFSKMPDDLAVEFKGIKEDTENFDPELVDIEKENFDLLFSTVEKKHPDAIKKGGKLVKTKPATKKKVAPKRAGKMIIHKSRGLKPMKKSKTELKGYSKSISEATGVTDQKTLDKLEEYMREDIFHSTLDWQTKAEFNQGALEAVEMYNEIYPDKKITIKGTKKFAPKSRGMKKAGYTGEIKKGDVFLWKMPSGYAEAESETEVRGVDKEKNEVLYMEGFSTIASKMGIDRFRKGIIKKVSGKTEASGANQVEECRKVITEAGYTIKKKPSKDGKKAMKVKVVRQERSIIKDKVEDTFKTISKDISGSEEKDKKYAEMQKSISQLQDLMTKFFNRLNNLAEDNSTEKIEKIIKLIKEVVKD